VLSLDDLAGVKTVGLACAAGSQGSPSDVASFIAAGSKRPLHLISLAIARDEGLAAAVSPKARCVLTTVRRVVHPYLQGDGPARYMLGAALLRLSAVTAAR